MKQYYTIGEISKIYQIGTDSLRYYEKLGILSPRRGANGYRIYGLDDLWKLNVIRDLRRLDFPMEKIRNYMQNRSIESTRTLLEEELGLIEEHMKALEKLKENVSERLSTLEKATRQPLDTVILKHFPKRKCHILNHLYHTDEEMDMLIKQLMNKDKNHLYIIGNNRIGSFLPLGNAKNDCFENYSGVFIIDPNGTDELDDGDYLTICYQGDSHQHQTYFPMLEEYADKHHLTLSGDLLEFLWIDIHQSANYGEHITELQIKADAPRNTERACSEL